MESNGKDLMTEEGYHPLSDFELQTEKETYATLHLLSVLEFSDLRMIEQLVKDVEKISLLLHWNMSFLVLNSTFCRCILQFELNIGLFVHERQTIFDL